MREVQKKADEKVQAIKNKYQGYVQNLNRELKLSGKLNSRLNEYIEKLKKELVFAKVIIKDPKKMKKASNLMNYSIYRVDKPPSCRSFHSLKRSSVGASPGRKLLSKTPNESFSFCPTTHVDSLRTSFTTSPPPVSSGRLKIKNFLKQFNA